MKKEKIEHCSKDWELWNFESIVRRKTKMREVVTLN